MLVSGKGVAMHVSCRVCKLGRLVCWVGPIMPTPYAGMEATIANLVEPGETVVVGNKGIWGARVVDMAGRFGGAHPLIHPVVSLQVICTG